MNGGRAGTASPTPSHRSHRSHRSTMSVTSARTAGGGSLMPGSAMQRARDNELRDVIGDMEVSLNEAKAKEKRVRELNGQIRRRVQV